MWIGMCCPYTIQVCVARTGVPLIMQPSSMCWSRASIEKKRPGQPLPLFKHGMFFLNTECFRRLRVHTSYRSIVA